MIGWNVRNHIACSQYVGCRVLVWIPKTQTIHKSNIVYKNKFCQSIFMQNMHQRHPWMKTFWIEMICLHNATVSYRYCSKLSLLIKSKHRLVHAHVDIYPRCILWNQMRKWIISLFENKYVIDNKHINGWMVYFLMITNMTLNEAWPQSICEYK